MSALDQLVRVHRWELDEKRRTLSDLERLADKLRADLTALDQEIERERALASRSLDTRRAFNSYIEAANERRETLARSIEQIEREIETARNEVNAAFQEVKKYELARANELRRENERLRRREQAQLDELGLTLHRRREAGGD